MVWLLLAACGGADDEPPTPGARELGDPLFPGLGNGGYAVDRYELDLRYETAAPSQPLDGTVTVHAHATQALSQLDLDFAGDAIGAVRVDGQPAAFAWADGELVITPSEPIHRGDDFTITVEHFAATPAVASAEVLLGAPFFVTPDGSAWAHQPDRAHRVFPCNDHPSNPAAFAFRIDVPDGTTAVANGELVGEEHAGGRAIWRYEQREPMATELSQVVVGAFTVTDRGMHAGVHVRDVTPTRLTDAIVPKLAVELAQLDWMIERVGPYPFATYGTLAADAELGFALETQGLSLFTTAHFDNAAADDPVMTHELAHQWFGDSVTPARWSDVWLNEGHATWYELTWQADVDTPGLVELAHQLYGSSDALRAKFGAVAAPPSGDPRQLFNSNVYRGGFLVLFALHQEIGDAAFRAVERAWVTTYRGRAASTEDYIALATQTSGRDVTAFLRAWLYNPVTPPMPGHPDWIANAPPTFAPAIEPKR
jgi:aminopeptidase N